jgi:hypothetical protein
MMAKKIFVTYKHSDSAVARLPSVSLDQVTTARNYVDELQNLFAGDHIYKGELDGEDLSGFKDSTIKSKLRDKIYDSSLTIVLISKNMKDNAIAETEQWIPWEISYSLREVTRDERTSATNAMLAVILPDESASYSYLVEQNNCTCRSLTFKNESLFNILGKNMFNRKSPITQQCANNSHGAAIHQGDDHSYIFPIKWEEFVVAPNRYIDIAIENNSNIEDFNVTKSME